MSSKGHVELSEGKTGDYSGHFPENPKMDVRPRDGSRTAQCPYPDFNDSEDMARAIAQITRDVFPRGRSLEPFQERNPSKPMAGADAPNLNPGASECKQQRQLSHSASRVLYDKNEADAFDEANSLTPSCNPEKRISYADVLKLNTSCQGMKPTYRYSVKLNRGGTGLKPECEGPAKLNTGVAGMKPRCGDPVKLNIDVVRFKPACGDLRKLDIEVAELKSTGRNISNSDLCTRPLKSRLDSLLTVLSKADNAKQQSVHANSISRKEKGKRVNCEDTSREMDTLMKEDEELHENPVIRQPKPRWTSKPSALSHHTKRNSNSNQQKIDHVHNPDKPVSQADAKQLNYVARQVKRRPSVTYYNKSCSTYKANTRQRDQTRNLHRPSIRDDELPVKLCTRQFQLWRRNGPSISHKVNRVYIVYNSDAGETGSSLNIDKSRNHASHTNLNPGTKTRRGDIKYSATITYDQLCQFVQDQQICPASQTPMEDGDDLGQHPAISPDSADKVLQRVDPEMNFETVPCQQCETSQQQTPVQSIMQPFVEDLPFTPMLPVVNISIPRGDSDSAGRSLQHGGHSRLDSDDEGYSGISDCMTSDSDIDPESPEMRALASLSPDCPSMRAPAPLSPDSHVARALGCPFPQGQLKESRVLTYLKSVRGFHKQSVETPETQFTHLLQVPYMQNPWTSSPRECPPRQSVAAEPKPHLGTLRSGAQRLEAAAEMWKDNYEQLIKGHELERLDCELQVRKLQEQLAKEMLKSYSYRMNSLKVMKMAEETRLEVEGMMSQLAISYRGCPQDGHMPASAVTSEYPHADSRAVSQAQLVVPSTDVMYSCSGMRNYSAAAPQQRPQTENLQTAWSRTTQALTTDSFTYSFPGIRNTSVPRSSPPLQCQDFSVYHHLYSLPAQAPQPQGRHTRF